MNKLASLAAGMCFALGVAAAAPSAGAESTTPSNDRNNVCLWTYRIDHTHYIRPRTLLFYMKGGPVWQNTLVNDCTGLDFHGFAYVTHDGQICSNMQSIVVLKTHETCLLGAFTPYTPPPKAAL